MGKNTKDFLKQIIISVIIGIVTGLGGAYVVVMKTQAANNERIDQHSRDIQELKDCSDKKVNQSMFDYSVTTINERLGRIEQNQIETIKLIKNK